MAQEKRHSTAGKRFGALKKYISANTKSASNLSDQVTEAGKADIQTGTQQREQAQTKTFGDTYTPDVQIQKDSGKVFDPSNNEVELGGLYGESKKNITDKTTDIGNIFDDNNEIKLDNYQTSKFATGEGDKKGSDLITEYGQTKAQEYAYDPYAYKKAEQQANQLGTESGRFGLLKQRFGQTPGRADYTRGQQKFDQLLLQTKGDKLRDTQTQLRQDKAAGVAKQNEFQTDVKDAFGGTPENQGQLGNLAEKLRNRVKDINVVGQTQGLRDEYQQSLLNAQSASQKQKDDLIRAIDANIFTDEQAQLLGIKKDDIYGNQGLKIDSSILGDYRPEYGDVLSAEQQAKYKALSSLAGTSDAEKLSTGQIGEGSFADIANAYKDKWATKNNDFKRNLAVTNVQLAKKDNLINNKSKLIELRSKANSFNGNVTAGVRDELNAIIKESKLTQQQVADMVGIPYTHHRDALWHAFSSSSGRLGNTIDKILAYSRDSDDYKNAVNQKKAVLQKYGAAPDDPYTESFLPEEGSFPGQTGVIGTVIE